MGRDRGPAGRVCLVYRQRISEARPAKLVADAQFHLIDSPWKLYKVWIAWVRCRGAGRLPRVMARLVGPDRVMYCVVEKDRIVHEGWLAVGRSPLYDVGGSDVVIGPMETDECARGRGHASFGLERAIQAMHARGHDVFYIHTDDSNAASRSVIRKCGFGPPVATISLPAVSDRLSNA